MELVLLTDWSGQQYEARITGHTTSALHGDLILADYRPMESPQWLSDGAFRVDHTTVQPQLNERTNG